MKKTIYFIILLLMASMSSAQTIFVPFNVSQTAQSANSNPTLSTSAVSEVSQASLYKKFSWHDKIRVSNGKFVNSLNQRVRFIGVNLTFAANFQTPAEVDKMIHQFKFLGINLVRLHHLDSGISPKGLFLSSANTTSFNEDQLKKLDYLIHALNKNGIYINLNLKVSRKFTKDDGFIDADKLPNHSKKILYFYPKAIQLQKDYATALLKRINTYNGIEYGKHVALAMIEITNEDGLFEGPNPTNWIPYLPSEYKNELSAQWNQFLINKYNSDFTKLKNSWGVSTSTQNILKNSIFANNNGKLIDWKVQNYSTAVGIAEIFTVNNTKAVRLKKTAPGSENWHSQFSQLNLSMNPGQVYTLEFSARTTHNTPERFDIRFIKSDDPKAKADISFEGTVDSNWKKYKIIGSFNPLIQGPYKLAFMFGATKGNIELMDLKLRSGHILNSNESLSQKNLEIPADIGTYGAAKDKITFLSQLETSFCKNLKDHVKPLSAYTPMTCSQTAFGDAMALQREIKSNMDFYDTHAYWDHPKFPAGQSWVHSVHSIKNKPMVSDLQGGTFPEIANRRPLGKPFTISEYNHCSPNYYVAETLPLAMGFLLAHDWDGIMLFDYGTIGKDIGANFFSSYFGVAANPGRSAYFPVLSRLLRYHNTGLNARSAKLGVLYGYSNSLESSFSYRKATTMTDIWKHKSALDLNSLLNTETGFQFTNSSKINISQNDLSIPFVYKSTNRTTTSRYSWFVGTNSIFSFAIEGGGAYVASPVKANDVANISDLQVQFKQNSAFVSLAAVTLDQKSIKNSSKILITLMGRVQNKNMGWNNTFTSVGTNWGLGPSEIEIIPSKFQIHNITGDYEAFTLDSEGKIQKSISVNKTSASSISLETTTNHHSPWILIRKK